MTSSGPLPGTRKRLAPAKVNLGLRVTGVREDGYHLLESVFAPIALWDEVEVEVEQGPAAIAFELATPESEGMPESLAAVTPGSDNLAVRAAEAFARATGLECSIRIRLRKRIPAAAGLGGGSSDAAAVLLALSELSGDLLAPRQLAELALGLGADVPFFLAPAPALVRGIGEEIEPLAGIPPLDLVLANPGISLATAEVYRAADALRIALTQPRPGSTMRAISRLGGETGDLGSALGELLANDLEPAARRLCPPIARLAEALSRAGALGVGLSGSGATVFGVFGSSAQAADGAGALRAAAPEAGWVEVTRIISE